MEREHVTMKQRHHGAWAIVILISWAWFLAATFVLTFQPDFWTTNTRACGLAISTLCFGAVLACLVAYVFFITIHWKRLCRQAAVADGLLCPSCRYSLRGLGAEAPGSNCEIDCPECGYATTRRAMVEHWDLLPPPPIPPANN